MEANQPQRRSRRALAFVGVLALAVVIVIFLVSNRPTTGRATVHGSTASPVTTVSGSSATAVHSTAGTTGSSLNSPTSTLQNLRAAKVVSHGPSDRKRIALTFDDNYQKPSSFRTLEVLEKYEVPATFFVIGHYVDIGPKLAKAIAAGGFEVGDHTRSHADCPTLSKRALRIEIGNGTDHYRQLTGAPTIPLFRPPYGLADQKTREVAVEKGFEYVVTWDIDTKDWKGRTAAQITEAVMNNAHNGAIVLMHEGAKHTSEALPGIIKRLRARGYELVTVSELLQM